MNDTLHNTERSMRLAKLRNGEIGTIHSWELVTAVDGPGTRLTVFFAGCPLRCLYCHNPDTMTMRNGKDTTVDEIVHKALRYKNIFDATNGGVTLSGGEVLMQPAFAANILKELTANGIHTTIDTSGFLGIKCTDDMLKNINLVLLDIKSGDEETYFKTTGRSLKPTIKFAERLDQKNVPMWVRFVLVPDLTSDPDNVEKVAKIVSRFNNVERIEILPFHQMGTQKWDELGLPYSLRDVKPPTSEMIQTTKDIFTKHNPNVIVF